MPISPIEILSPQTPNSLTALLQGGTNTLTNAINNAVQVGRDSVNNQTQQNRDLLSERRSEINLKQRRDENIDDQGNSDRAFDEQQRQFGIREGRLSASDALRSEKTRLEIAEFRDTKDIRGREVDARLKATELQNKKLDQEAAFLPTTLETRRITAENARVKATNETLSLARSGEERDHISSFSDGLKQSLDAYQGALEELEADTSKSAQEKQTAKATLEKGLNGDMELLGRQSLGKGVSPATSKALITLRDNTLVSQGITPSADTRANQITKGKNFEALGKTLGDKDVFGKSISEEVKTIQDQSLDVYKNNFKKGTLTKTQIASRKKKRGAAWEKVRGLGTDVATEFSNTRPANVGLSPVSVLGDLLK